ncbi:MAG: DUF4011 domain-containing protein [Mycoplasmoidaceae bacterium]
MDKNSKLLYKNIDLWKQNLLDFSKKNRLINYLDTKRMGFEIITMDIFEIWEIIVLKNDSIQLLTGIKNEIISNFEKEEIKKTLNNLKNESRSFLKEKGISILYIAVGFLLWNDTKRNDEKDSILSPLILIPVELLFNSNDDITVKRSGEKILVNPVIFQKIKDEFNIILPLIEDNQSLKEYFYLVEKSLPYQIRMVHKTVLSLFPFTNIAIFKDLEINENRFLNHKLTNQILGISNKNLNKINIEQVNLDKNFSPLNSLNVLESDSSQLLAIDLANQGMSFILQGPPGTGKSQTITNIIANSISMGKKVLFVSEKIAALNVVYNRLKNAKLDSFCLPLHSLDNNSAVIKNIIEKYYNGLKINRRQKEITNQDLDLLNDLDIITNRLNSYVQILNNEIELTNELNLFKIINELSVLNNIDYQIFNSDIDDIKRLTYNEYQLVLKKIEEYTKLIGSKVDDINKNSWINIIYDDLPFLKKQSLWKFINKFNTNLNQFLLNIKNIENEFQIDCNFSIFQIENFLLILKIAQDYPNIPPEWILKKKTKLLLKFVQEIIVGKQLFIEHVNLVINYSQKNHDLIFDNDLQKYYEINYINQLIKNVSNIISNNNIYKKYLSIINWSFFYDLFASYFENLNQIKIIKQLILAKYDQSILILNITDLHERFLKKYYFKINFIFPKYHEDLKIIKKYLINKKEKINFNICLELLNNLKKLNELINLTILQKTKISSYLPNFNKLDEKDIFDLNKELFDFNKIGKIYESLNSIKSFLEKYYHKDKDFKNHFSFLYQGFETDWKDILQKLEWADHFSSFIYQYNLKNNFAEKLCNFKINKNLIKYAYETISKDFIIINQQLTDFEKLFNNLENIKQSNIEKIQIKVLNCINNFSQLDIIFKKKELDNFFKTKNIINFINNFLNNYQETNLLISIFKKIYLENLYEYEIKKYSEYIIFNDQLHQESISKLIDNKPLQLEIAIKRVINEINQIGDGINDYKIENKIIEEEFEKKRTRSSTRDFINSISNLLLEKIPCLMMSPLTVSTYLEHDKFNFDVVIFDEASQISPENAICSIARSNQVIIVGDDKQLPPTNFFQNNNLVEQDDELVIYNSLLDIATEKLPKIMLKWHYRSQHESLINFSNINIYNNELITIPNAIGQQVDQGIDFYYLNNGIYNRGTTRDNLIEAEFLIKLIHEHIEKRPEKSLGIITFNINQRMAILKLVEKIKNKNAKYRDFFKQKKDDNFFVKNIEMVQGDERDVIFLSICYGKSPSGKMSQSFGAIGLQDGEKRLNVAITRSKINLKVISSINDEDIITDNATNIGPAMLKKFLEYVKNKSIIDMSFNNKLKFSSFLEQDIYEFLIKCGYEADINIGQSNFKINLAIKNPNNKVDYILAITCDGKDYFDFENVEDREYLRRVVLDQRKWNHYHVNSLSWIQNRTKEQTKIKNLLSILINKN